MVKDKKLNEQIFFKKFESDKERLGLKKAKKVLKKSCAFQAQNEVPCRYTHAFVLVQEGKLKKARLSLENLIESRKNQKLNKTKYFLSQIYLKEGLSEKSMQTLDKILGEDENYAPALNFKAYTISKTAEDRVLLLSLIHI